MKRIVASLLVWSIFVLPLNAIVIKDGKGTGNTAEVDENNRLQVFAIQESEFEKASEDGNAYAWVTRVIWNTADGDTLLLIKNTNSSARLHIDKMWVSVSTNAGVIVHLPSSEVTPTGTILIGNNLNATSNNVANAAAVALDTDNTQGTIIWHTFPEAGESEIVEFDGAIIIGQNQSFAIDLASGTQRSQITVWGHYGN